MTDADRRSLDERDLFDSLPGATFTGHWSVVRKGRPSARWRVLTREQSENLARERFSRAVNEMRQGVVMLVGPTCLVIDYVSEPMARSRW